MKGGARAVLIATMKNEAPYLLEWVAWHRMIVGFADILVWQNDSDDGTVETLEVLQEIGALRWFDNSGADPGRHQIRAYSRATRRNRYQKADWVLALDADEFLNIHAGDGRIADLLAVLPEADRVFLNWRIFGSGGAEGLTDDLVIERFTRAQDTRSLVNRTRQIKTLFRRDFFKRSGIHHAALPLDPTRPIRTTNGSGLPEHEIKVRGHRASDAGAYAHAQINHYMVRDAMSFVLKGLRGTANGTVRTYAEDYWRAHNLNTVEDRTIQARLSALKAAMMEMDRTADGRLSELRAQALAHHRSVFNAARARPDIAALYDYCRTHG